MSPPGKMKPCASPTVARIPELMITRRASATERTLFDAEQGSANADLNQTGRVSAAQQHPASSIGPPNTRAGFHFREQKKEPTMHAYVPRPGLNFFPVPVPNFGSWVHRRR